MNDVVARAGRDDVGGRRSRHVERRGHGARVQVLEVHDADGVAGGLVGPAGHGEVNSRDGARRRQHQRVRAGSAIDRRFAAARHDRVVAAAAADDVGAAGAVDRIVAGATGDRVGRSRSGDRRADCKRRGIHVDEIGDVDGISHRLVGIAEVDGRRVFQHQRVGSHAAIDRDFGAVIRHGVVADPRRDRIPAAAAVDSIVAGAGGDRIRRRRPRDDDAGRDNGCVDVLEIGDVDRVADGLVGAGCHAQIHARDAAGIVDQQRIGAEAAIDQDFGASVVDRIVATSRIDDVGAAAAIDDIGARTARDHVGLCVARDRNALCGRKRAGIDIPEAGGIDRIADGLVHGTQIDRGDGLELQGVGAGTAGDGSLGAAIGDRIVAGAGIDDVSPASAVDRVVAGASGDEVGETVTENIDPLRGAEQAGVDVLEVRHRDGVADGLVDMSQIDIGRRSHRQRIDAGPRIDRRLGAVIGDRVVARAGVDDIGTATAINGVVAGAGQDRVGNARAGNGERGRQGAGVEILEIRDRDGIARCLVGARHHGKIHRRNGRSRADDQCVRAGTAVGRNLGAMDRDDISARPGADDVGAAIAVDRVRAAAARNDVRRRRAQDRNPCRDDAGIDIDEIGNRGRVAQRLVDCGEVDVGRGAQHQRVAAGPAVDRDFCTPIVDGIIAGTGLDDVSAATTADRVVAGTGLYRVGQHGARNRQRRRHRGGVDVLEVDDAGDVARGLIETGSYREIDRRNGAGVRKHQRVVAVAAIDADLAAVNVHQIVARAGRDRIGAAAAIDHIGARSSRNGIGRRRPRDGRPARQRRRIDVLEIGDVGRIEGRLIGVSEVDHGCRAHHQRVGAATAVDRNFGAPVRGGVVAGTAVDDVSAATAVDRVRPAAAGQDVGGAGADDRDVLARSQSARIDVLEVG